MVFNVDDRSRIGCLVESWIRPRLHYIISQIIIFNNNRYGDWSWLEKNQRICCTVHVLKVLDEDDNIIFTHTDPSDYTNADAPRSFVIDVNPDTVVRVGKKVRNEPSEQTLTPSSCYLSSLYYLVTQSLTLSRLLFIRHPPSASMDSMMASWWWAKSLQMLVQELTIPAWSILTFPAHPWRSALIFIFSRCKTMVPCSMFHHCERRGWVSSRRSRDCCWHHLCWIYTHTWCST